MKYAVNILFCTGNRVAVGWSVATTHYAYHLIDVALTINGCTAAHDTGFVAGELIAGIADRRSDVAALVLYPAEPEEVDLLLAVYDTNISIVRFGGRCGWFDLLYRVSFSAVISVFGASLSETISTSAIKLLAEK